MKVEAGGEAQVGKAMEGIVHPTGRHEPAADMAHAGKKPRDRSA